MSILTAALFLLLTTTAMATTPEEWAKFKVKHEKLYFTSEEDTMRSRIWKKNVVMVEKHNSENHTFTMAVNKFSDWTTEEFNRILGFGPTGEISNGRAFKLTENMETPDEVDFREDDLVTPVKDQANCGSWAISTTGAIEGAWAKHKGELVNLSQEQLVACNANASGGCGSGLEKNAFQYVIDNGGIDSEESYKGQCHEDPSEYEVHITGYEIIKPDEHEMEAALVKLGYPISVAVLANDNWLSYQSGIFEDPSCKVDELNQLNHAVLIVGFNKTGPEPFWIVKNSWGTEWGENGYIKMKMGVNICGINKYVSYPTV